MEFQNANGLGDNNDDNHAANQEKPCDCGCGITFCTGFGMGFKILIGDDDAIMEAKIVDKGDNDDNDVNESVDWNDYIKIDTIRTWGQLISLITTSRRIQ